MSLLRPAWVEINLDAMAHNVAQVRRLIGPACKLFGVIKGDAYGTGAIEAARTLQSAGADALALGNPDDVAPIRAAGVRLPILLYGSTMPEQAAVIASLGVIPTIHDFAGLHAFSELPNTIGVYAKVDCGLGRLGFGPAEWQRAFRQIRQARSISLEGIYTHFSNPDDAALTERQAQLFTSACRTADAEGHAGYIRMASSSRILLTRPDLNLTAVNPGRLLYGHVENDYRNRLDFRPVVAALKARIIQLKDLSAGSIPYGGSTPLASASRLAVVPIGVCDGLNHMPPCHVGLVRGKRASVLGRRGVEHTVLDVSHVEGAAIGDEVVFLGTQAGQSIDAIELANAVKLPLIELLPRLGRMAPRRYIGLGSDRGGSVRMAQSAKGVA